MRRRYFISALPAMVAVLIALGAPAQASESTRSPAPQNAPATKPTRLPVRPVRKIPTTPEAEQPPAAPLKIVSPAQYEGWTTDVKHLIRWTTSLPAETRVKIEIIRAGWPEPNLWKMVVADTANSGSYEWQGVPAAQYTNAPSTFQVRISALNGSAITTSEVFLFGRLFYLHEPAKPYTWRKGSQATIVWEAISPLPDPVNLDLLDSNRQPVLSIAAGINRVPRASTNKREVYQWPIPSDLASGSYFIRASSGPLSGEKPINIADAIVFPVSPQITITEPKYCDGWATDAQHTIRWTSTLPPDSRVKIELVQTGIPGIVLWRTLDPNAPNSGSYEWEGITAADLHALTACVYVRISTLDDAQVTVGPPFIIGRPLTLVEPRQAFTWRKGSNGTIIWELVCQMPDPINLDLLDSNHQPVLNIASGLGTTPRVSTNKRQVYVWTIPATVTPGSYFIGLTCGSISQEKPINIAEPIG
ncbi:MAG: hypothetical protein A2Y77_15630 [Planctomycetes bacterium RBG_13_62_9]|nr:MAG: hypothetical protein A2Y77_15630 [Planctomycetes bacterium RBG_13_62_9]